MSITVTAEHAAAIRRRLSGGEFASASEVVRAALRHWFEAERREQQQRFDRIAERLQSAEPAPDLTTAEVRSLLARIHQGVHG